MVEMKYYTIYKITNNIDGKYYIGQHTTEDLDDGYMGSGKLIYRAIQKHGIENFTKEYLRFCSSPEELNLIEEELVIINEVDPNSYNLTKGGNKPPVAKKGRKSTRPKFPNGYGYKHTPEALEAIRKWTIENQPMNNPESRKKVSASRMGMKFSEEHRKNLRLSHLGKASPNKGKKMSEEQKEKIRKSKAANKLKWKLDPETNKRVYYKDGTS